MTAENFPKRMLRTLRGRAERILDPDARGARLELQRLSISQEGALVTIHLRLSAGLTPLAVRAKSGEELFHLADVHPASPDSHRPGARVNQGNGGTDYIAQFRLDTVPLFAVSMSGDGEGVVLPVVLEILTPDGVMPRYAVESRPEDGHSRGIISLGRFRRTAISGLRPVVHPETSEAEVQQGKVRVLYVSRNGFVRLAVDRVLKPYHAVYVKRISVAGGVLRLSGRLHTRHGDVVRAELVLVGRQSGARYSARVGIKLDEIATVRHFGLREYQFSARLRLGDLSDEQVARDSILDAWLELDDGAGEPLQRARIGRTRYVVRKLTLPGWQRRGSSTLCITPYYTFKAKNTSFHIELLDTDAFEYLQEATRNPLLRRPSGNGTASRPVWVVGEQPYKAQDTGLAFFRYLRVNHPEIDAYYVIDPGSPEVRNLDGLGNVVPYRSKKHMEVALRAERFIGSHHPDFLYPTRLPQFRRSVRGTKVFLQHGVMGTKWMVPNYGRNAPGFETDLFLVSSDREKEYIVSDFGYAPQDVAITGLSRFDTLFAEDVPVKSNQILVIPTWRDWLQDPERFSKSQYLRAWTGFLKDPRLHSLAEQYGAEVVFCLHPNMQQFRSQFADIPAKVISQGEVDVQHLLKESALLITDYSSVGFDFSFLDKPVLYYQFDRERFLGRRGSHLDLDAELPGRIAFDRSRLLDVLAESLASGCAMKPEYVRRSRRFLKYKDRNNCARIFEAVVTAKPATSGLRAGTVQELATLMGKRFRRSRYYFPLMRRMFTMVSRAPMDPELIVFESGLGTQYADSPRYIYEELVRRGDRRRKVWVSNKKLPHPGPNTKVVRRLSPGYFWHLARAKYWVNNQNFPHYLRRRPNGVFIQTWHGTPLKRMLLDMEHIHGRDEDYLQRVRQAVRQWSVLLSPSPYATEAFRSAFGYKGRVVEEGYPRDDVLAAGRRTDTAEVVRERLGIPGGKRVVLYAPTFRDDQATGSGRFDFSLPLDLEAFAERFGEDTLLLLRMHVLVAGHMEIPESASECVRDVSSYPEIQELLLASDVLVTDYSSVLFDYAILRRPIVFYAYDLEHYRDTLRGFYLDYGPDLPGPVVHTQDELFEALAEAAAPDSGRERRLQEFAARFAPKDDGGASRRVVDLLLPPIPPQTPGASTRDTPPNSADGGEPPSAPDS